MIKLVQLYLISSFAIFIFAHKNFVPEGKASETVMKPNISGCWIERFARRPILEAEYCGPGKEKIGSRCYDKCEKGWHGIGPICRKGLRTKARGWGKIGKCPNGSSSIRGQCYEDCPQRYLQSGPFCSENCPSSRPFPCDKICVRDQRDCTVEKMQIARSSLGITQGIFGIISSSLRIVGTAGLGPLIGAFGIGQSGFGTGTSYLNVLETLTKYPMCYEYPKETEKSRLIKYSLKSYSHIMAQYCKLPDPVVETFF